MKRIAIKLVLFLLLGAVANLGVAWGCAAWGPPAPGVSRQAVPGGNSAWPRPAPHWPLPTSAGSARSVTNTVDTAGSHDASDTIYLQALVQHGVPLRAMELEYRSTISSPGAVRNNSTLGAGMAVPSWLQPRNHDLLPMRPIFPGFLINTLFYAVVLWLLWSTSFATRRLIRRRRGRCVRCGYDLRHAEHEVCPECGA